MAMVWYNAAKFGTITAVVGIAAVAHAESLSVKRLPGEKMR